MFGHGWTSTWDQHLNFSSRDSSITAVLSDGSELTAQPDGSGGLVTPAWTDSTMQRNSDGTVSLVLRKKEILTFAGSGDGHLVSVGDLNGYRLVLTYAAGHLTGVTDASGRTVTVSTDVTGAVTSIVDPIGRTTTYGYSNGDLVKVTRPLARVWAYAYEAQHHMTTMTDSRGGTTTNTYDGSGRVTRQVDPAGLAATYAYTGDNFSSLGGTTTLTDPHGVIETQQYANGFLARLTKAVGTPAEAVWTYTYDPSTFGVVASTDPNGHVTKHTYNAAGLTLTTTDPAGGVTTMTYDNLNDQTSLQTPLGNRTTHTYDTAGNLLSTTDAAAAATRYTYSTVHPGDVATVTDSDGRVTTMTYNGHGDPASSSVSPSPSVVLVTVFSHDADGETVCQVNPLQVAAGITCPSDVNTHAAWTRSSIYDAAGEVTATIDAAGHRSTFSYDANGNRKTATDGSGVITTQNYDEDNRLTSTTRGGSTTTESYDVAPGSGACTALPGQVQCLVHTDARAKVTVDHLDALGHRIRRSRPLGRDTSFTYDGVGNMRSENDAEGRSITRTYDALDRLVSVDYSDPATPDVTTVFDPDGRRTSMSDGTGTTSATYDAVGRTITVTDGSGAVVRYGYDHAGNVTSITYPNGKTVTHAFDGAGRMTSLTDWRGTTTSFTYDANGNPVRTAYPGGGRVTATFDAANTMTATAAGSGTSTLASLAFTRNGASRVSRILGSGSLKSDRFIGYDNRAQVVTGAGYDAAGNPTSLGSSTQGFDAADGLTTATVGGVVSSYSFDGEGNRRSVTSSTTTETLTYNQASELTSASETAPVAQVTAVNPASGPVRAGTTVTLSGTGLGRTSAVMVGSHAALAVTILSNSALTVVLPAGSAGAVHVLVIGPHGTSAASTADVFNYQNVPTLRAATSPKGSTGGGNSVVITGTGLLGARSVSFGSVSTTRITGLTGGRLAVVAPAGRAGNVAVRVITSAGTSAPLTYTYVGGTYLRHLSAQAGPTAGGRTLTIEGPGIGAGTAARFGSVIRTVRATSSTTLTVLSPPHAAGAVHVSVRRAGVWTPVSSDDVYTFESVPSVTAVSPASGLIRGGTPVIVTGVNLAGTQYVYFGGVRAATVSQLTSTQVLALAPAATAGTVDIRITTPIGRSALGTRDKFSNLPTPAAVRSTVTSTYGYDGDGLRTAVGPAHVTWDRTTTVPRILNDGALSFIYGPGNLPVEQLTVSDQPSFFMHDNIGSTRALIGPMGAIAATFSYSTYGALASATGTARTPLTFGQGYADAGSGHIYLVRRYYDPATAQFLTVDPAVDSTRAAYAYTNGDPVNGVDPAGLWSVGVCFGICLGYDANAAKAQGVLRSISVGAGTPSASVSWNDHTSINLGGRGAGASVTATWDGPITVGAGLGVGGSITGGNGRALSGTACAGYGLVSICDNPMAYVHDSSPVEDGGWSRGPGCNPVGQASYGSSGELQPAGSWRLPLQGGAGIRLQG